jgi:hypothetical protein
MTLSTRADVAALAGLVVHLSLVGAKVQWCARPVRARLLAHVGVPVNPVGV